ncbi:zf-TFIIB domain-containing protein [Mesoterricola sediminis]|uniref:Transcription factor zinc-finger domain-containing protein n=1 Tax=Mesoterricola sediminis TaxID=2927980 RepID=A0AA48GP26_9BACT|nr:zf-TFIIB domain-containing protein [Mesoterricola sediminis]BDU76646.1 hypothetical protein METESE_16040 [Mesoterricola sediminis]
MDVGSLHCPSCGAAVKEDDLQCPYCRSQLATVACPQCLGLVSKLAAHCPRCGAAVRREAASPSGLGCPTCRKPLLRSTVGKALLDQCATCGGVWLGTEAFDQVAADREERGSVLGALPGASPQGGLDGAAVSYRPCPACGQLMNRTNYARSSGVIIDTCRNHGVWFDRDELRRVLEFVEAGGLDRARAKEKLMLEERRRELTSAAALGDAPSGGWEGGAWGRGDRDGGLVETLVRGLFGF